MWKYIFKARCVISVVQKAAHDYNRSIFNWFGRTYCNMTCITLKSMGMCNVLK